MTTYLNIKRDFTEWSKVCSERGYLKKFSIEEDELEKKTKFIFLPKDFQTKKEKYINEKMEIMDPKEEI